MRPAPPLTAAGPEAIDRLIGPPLFPHPIAEWPMPTEVIAYDRGPLQVGPFTLRLRSQRHPGGSVGLRVDDDLAYVTDTEVDPATEVLVRGVDLLLHEVWRTDAEARHDDPSAAGHSAAGPVALLAARAQVRRVAPVHHPPHRDAAAVRALCAEMTAVGGIDAMTLEEGGEVFVG